MGRPFLWLALAAAAGAGCRARPPAPPSADRVVLKTPARDEAPPTQPPEWYDEQIEAAEAEIAAGRLAAALQIVYRARAEKPPPAAADELAEILGRLNRDVLELDTLHGRVEPVRDPLEFDRPVRVRVRLTNRTDRPIRVPAATADGRSMLTLDVERVEWDTQAQVVSTARRFHLPLARDLSIPPRGMTEQTFEIGMFGNDRGLDGFRVFRVSGLLRPVVLELGELRRWDAIALLPGEVRSFRPNWEHLAGDPVARIEQALVKRAPVHLLTAAGLAPPEARRDAVDRLVAALELDPAMDAAIFSSLRYLTRIELGRDADAWRAWWPRVRATYFASAAAKDGDATVPRFDTGE